MVGDLKKPLFIHAQDWYRPSFCVDCPEFVFVPLSEGAVAYCSRVENDCQCIFEAIESGETDIEIENVPDSSTVLLGMETERTVEVE